MPAIGIADPEPLDAAARAAIAGLAPAHLRLDVDLEAPEWISRLEAGLEDCAAVGAAAELAIFLPSDPWPALAALRERVEATGVPVARILVFRHDEETTGAAWVALARASLGGLGPIGGGTNLYFNELNRSLPDRRHFDVVSWSLNPQVHAFTDLDLVESLDGQGDQVRSGRALAAGLPIAVTPISLRPRFNAVARTGLDAGPSEPLPPDNVDPRQPSVFAAAWLVGSLRQLTAAGAGSLTYFETAGPRGVLQGEEEIPAPFPSRAGTVFPVFHVLADAVELRAGRPLACESGEEPWLSALAVETGGAATVLLANLTAIQRRVRLPAGCAASAAARVLDDSTVERARTDPAAFRRSTRPLEPAGGFYELELDAYASARVELPLSPAGC